MNPSADRPRQPTYPNMTSARDTAEKLLSRAATNGATAEVFSAESESRSVEFGANRPKNISTRQSAGHALRLIADGKIGFASTTDSTRVEELAERAASVAEFGAEARFEFPGPANAADVDAHDPQVDELDDEAMLDVGESIVARVLAAFPQAQCDVHITTARHSQRLINSAGSSADATGTGHSVMVGTEIISGTDMLSVWDGVSSASVLTSAQVDDVVGRVLANLTHSQRIVPAPSADDLPVIFTPQGLAGAILPPLLSGFNGNNVATGASPLIDRWGEKAFDARLTIYDDPLRPMTPGTRASDDEGVPARRTPLISQGVIGEPILDLQTAAKCEMASNGCGLRSLATTPSPGTSYLCVEPGDGSDTLLEGVENGIVVQQLLGAGQGNELGGDFRANLSLGFLVQHGEIVGRIKDTMVAGNVFQVLNRVEAMSSKLQNVWGRSELPSLRCRGVEIAAA